MSKEGKELKPVNVDSSKQLATYESYNQLKAIASDLYKSGLFTHLKNPQQAIAVVEFGRELGVPPMQSLQSMAVISGKMCMTAQLMLALAKSNGYSIKIKKNDASKCEIDFIDPVGDKHPVEFTIQEAESLGLSGKDNWKKQPENMLFWRTVSKAIRRFAPETLLGIYTIEEMTGGEAITIEEIEEENEKEPQAKLPDNANQFLTVAEIKDWEDWIETSERKLAYAKEEIEHREHLILSFGKMKPALLSRIRKVRKEPEKYDWEAFKKDRLLNAIWKELSEENQINELEKWIENNG